MQPAFFRSTTVSPIAYPKRLGGSYEALVLDRTWLIAGSHYRPYGYCETDAGYSRSQVNWAHVDGVSLQNDCLARDSLRVQNTAKLVGHARLSKAGWKHRLGLSKFTSPTRDPCQSTGRTAIVIRTLSGYDYKQEDMINLRSLIMETALRSGGQYAVFFLVYIKDKARQIFHSVAIYETGLRDALPPELQSVAVLFDVSLLESWYRKVPEHS